MAEDDKYSITSRLDRALLDADQLPLVVERLRRELRVTTAQLNEALPKIRALEIAEQSRFTEAAAHAMYKREFELDLKERENIGKLVKIIYIPIGLIAVGVIADVIKGWFGH